MAVEGLLPWVRLLGCCLVQYADLLQWWLGQQQIDSSSDDGSRIGRSLKHFLKVVSFLWDLLLPAWLQDWQRQRASPGERSRDSASQLALAQALQCRQVLPVGCGGGSLAVLHKVAVPIAQAA